MSITERDHDAMRQIIAECQALDDATDGWNWKAEARETGLSLYVTFGKKQAGVETATRLINMLVQAPDRLSHLCDKIVAAGVLVPSDGGS